MKVEKFHANFLLLSNGFSSYEMLFLMIIIRERNLPTAKNALRIVKFYSFNSNFKQNEWNKIIVYTLE